MNAQALLKEIILESLTGSVTINKIEGHLGPVKELLKKLEKEGLIKIKEDIILPTKKGRSKVKVVLTGGVFDIIHPGHIYTLKKAKGLGELLVVVVARDKTVIKLRGKKAVNDEKLRLELVSSLKPVDLAILGSEHDMFEVIERIRPDIIALGYDQVHDEKELIDEGRKRGLSFKVIRLDAPYPHLKSTKLKSNPEIMNSF